MYVIASGVEDGRELGIRGPDSRGQEYLRQRRLHCIRTLWEGQRQSCRWSGTGDRHAPRVFPHHPVPDLKGSYKASCLGARARPWEGMIVIHWDVSTGPLIKSLSFQDRWLFVWILLAMILGVLLGEFTPAVRADKAHHGISPCIASK
jgi:hypothetical protein